MEKTVHTTTCDICKKQECIENGLNVAIMRQIHPRKVQVIFTTDQTEGRSHKPYLTLETPDICSDCYKRILKGEALYGAGAQGYNEYWFKKGE